MFGQMPKSVRMRHAYLHFNIITCDSSAPKHQQGSPHCGRNRSFSYNLVLLIKGWAWMVFPRHMITTRSAPIYSVRHSVV